MEIILSSIAFKVAFISQFAVTQTIVLYASEFYWVDAKCPYVSNGKIATILKISAFFHKFSIWKLTKSLLENLMDFRIFSTSDRTVQNF